ncbi:MAG: tRNA-dihydrouridine synthase family protein [Bacteriovoracaceae bacterium]|jgi:tRNA-dihydrouridine synthase|nr:tRNA-dihydrouridine synthase family protein [Bacteriovoracaceae bacterium]
MKTNLPLKEKSLLFAPMEGVTDSYYRKTVQDLFKKWDFIATDFLRIPSVGLFPQKQFLHHIGTDIYNTSYMDKTIFQILASERSLLEEHLLLLKQLEINWLDLNLGCPSKTVCKNKGGSYLLSDLKILKKILKTIRSSHKSTFTAKIRVGFEDDSMFEDILKLIEDEGVDAITIHARTRAQLYKGIANWDYVKQAVKISNIPIIGNGDIWTTKDIDNYFDYTQAHSVMIARGALKTPWLADLYYNNEEDTIELRIDHMKKYYSSLYEKMQLIHKDEKIRIKRLKAVSRYIFDPIEQIKPGTKRSFLLCQNYEQMQDVLNSI